MMLINMRMHAGKRKQRGARRQLKSVDVAFNIETDAEVALIFRLYHDSDLKNRDGSHNFIDMAAQFNTAFVKQVLTTWDGDQ